MTAKDKQELKRRVAEEGNVLRLQWPEQWERYQRALSELRDHKATELRKAIKDDDRHTYSGFCGFCSSGSYGQECSADPQGKDHIRVSRVLELLDAFNPQEQEQELHARIVRALGTPREVGAVEAVEALMAVRDGVDDPDPQNMAHEWARSWVSRARKDEIQRRIDVQHTEQLRGIVQELERRSQQR